MGEARSDGVTIRYDDAGRGEPALLCLPGWCGGRSAFGGVVEREARRRRVLSLDWRGHGESDRPPGDFSASALADDALAVVAGAGVQTVVPVALSHAGWVAIELRRRLGAARVPKLVLLDWIVTAAPPPFLAVVAALQRPGDWQAARERLFAMWLEAVGDRAVARYVRDDMGAYGFDMWARAGREIGAAYAAAHSPLEALAALDPPPPTLHVYAQPADPAYLEAQQAFAATHPWFHVERVDARSHFPMIEAPDRVVERIERFVTSER